MTPPAPLRLSTMNCLPSRLLNCAAIMRPTLSLMAPGGNGTMTRTGLTGYSCAAAAVVRASRKAAALSIIPCTLEVLAPGEVCNKAIDHFQDRVGAPRAARGKALSKLLQRRERRDDLEMTD